MAAMSLSSHSLGNGCNQRIGGGIYDANVATKLHNRCCTVLCFTSQWSPIVVSYRILISSSVYQLISLLVD
jgi:hypothetical protein